MNVEILVKENAFWHMVLSSIESYNRECLGFLIGTKNKNKFSVELAPIYLTAKRKKHEVKFPKRTKITRLEDALYDYDWGNIIGDFHSHPSIKRDLKGFYPSDVDLKTMKKNKIYIIIHLWKLKKGGYPWGIRQDKAFGCYLGDFNLRIGGWFINEEGDPQKAHLKVQYASP